ncbi:MAG: VWA domain-containing protein [Clostridia bacterium]|nr:VWA domain-containing protein [Clostridia bacterium]
MRKFLKLIFCMLLILFIMVYLSTNVFANTLSIIQTSQEKKLENEQGYISKKIVDSNANTGEVTIELEVANANKSSTDTSNNSKKNTEIFLIMDESYSMTTKLGGQSRRNVIRESSKALAKNILENYENVKIGVIKFADEAKMTTDLTDNIDEINKAISTYEGYVTNLDDALILAQNSYSSGNINKLAIILTDGCPNAISVHRETNENKLTTAQLTKQELINLNNLNVNIITMMTELESTKTAEEIFGTQENPTVGKYYYIADSDIDQIIKNNIYNDIIENIDNYQMQNVKIVDFFPQDITENFEFSYVANPNMGTTSKKIDENYKNIQWDIGTLKSGEVATLKYKLKIKNINNDELLNKTISTNEKVIVTYTDKSSKDYTVTLDDSPKIQLIKEKEVINDNKDDNTKDSLEKNENDENKKEESENVNEPKDSTQASGMLPNTGKGMMILLNFLIVSVISVILYKKNRKFGDIR